MFEEITTISECEEKIAEQKRQIRLNEIANRARIKAGHKLMNAFHRKIMNLIAEFDNADSLRSYSYIIQEFDDEEFIKLIRDYMEYCYD